MDTSLIEIFTFPDTPITFNNGVDSIYSKYMQGLHDIGIESIYAIETVPSLSITRRETLAFGGGHSNISVWQFKINFFPSF